jgi:uncharacterized protein (TIGR02466 family)
MNRTLLFPTAIWSDKFDIDNDKLAEYAINLRKQSGVILHELDGWRTSDNNIIFSDEFSELRKLIESNLDEIKTQVGFKKDSEFVLKTGWIYITNKGGWHPPHSHPEGDISCSYYIKVPEESNSAFAVNDPRKQNRWMDSPNFIEQQTPFTIGRFYAVPKTGEFLAFPSWLEHFVSPSMSDDDRIMVTMNYKIEENGSD